MKFPIEQEFKLSDFFMDKYKNKNPEFGFNGLGEFVFMRTYSRIKPDGKNEKWYETVQRVVEGIYSIQRQYIEDYKLGWNQAKAQASAQKMYDRIFNFKMIPSGRSLWAMGAPLIMEKGLTETLYSCSFLSTKDIKEDPGKIFANAMDFLMCGVGVGADILGANIVEIKPQKPNKNIVMIDDSREGWVDSVEQLVNSFFGGQNIEFDYSSIRGEGKPIKTFGGISAGSKPLIDLHENVQKILENNVGKMLSATNIVDIFNLIGKSVVSGNVRRSAEVILGDPEQEFLDLKNYSVNPKRKPFGWVSNNSIYAEIGMDYSEIAKRIGDNGEPGLCWLANFQEYGRMKETEKDYKDTRIAGGNPCMEIGLESSELCNLVEMFPARHEDLDDFKTTIKFAYLYAKSITLLNTHWQDTNRVMLRNRRIGLSMTGIAQFISSHNLQELITWMEEGYQTAKEYDKMYSEWFAIPESIKITTVKPSGTLSLLAGATPGIHFPESQHYIRRVRLSKNSGFIPVLEKAGYVLELAIGQEESTVVVSFPVSLGENIRTLKDISMWEQLNLAEFAQNHWADNSVSVTITFKKEEEDQIKNALDIFQFKLKAVSFLPKLEEKAYEQMPYESITKEEYEDMKKKLKPLKFSKMFSEESLGEKYCNNDTCELGVS